MKATHPYSTSAIRKLSKVNCRLVFPSATRRLGTTRNTATVAVAVEFVVVVPVVVVFATALVDDDDLEWIIFPSCSHHHISPGKKNNQRLVRLTLPCKAREAHQKIPTIPTARHSTLRILPSQHPASNDVSTKTFFAVFYAAKIVPGRGTRCKALGYSVHRIRSERPVIL
jgi:hypothetical protein